jgi:hypothetical protein
MERYRAASANLGYGRGIRYIAFRELNALQSLRRGSEIKDAHLHTTIQECGNQMASQQAASSCH